MVLVNLEISSLNAAPSEKPARVLP
ncbi:MAG: hypothetical protein QOC56_2695, partial [Alphaproteobacteria bacterium]|nr:hypothetical protein [Alphaproteobacteria bacterium]